MRCPERTVPGAEDLAVTLDPRDLDEDSRFSDHLPPDLSRVRYRLSDRSLLGQVFTAPITSHSRLNVGDVHLMRAVDLVRTEMGVVGDGLPC